MSKVFSLKSFRGILLKVRFTIVLAKYIFADFLTNIVLQFTAKKSLRRFLQITIFEGNPLKRPDISLK